MRIRRRVLVVVVSAGLIAAGLIPALGNSAGAAPFNVKQLNKIQRRLISGELLTEMGGSQVTPNVIPGGGDEDEGGRRRCAEHPAGEHRTGDRLERPAGQLRADRRRSVSQRLGSNVKVNQNCLNITDSDLQGRGQANNESFISQDPFNSSHLVASDNDYVRGDGTCGAAYSLDRGKTWNNSTQKCLRTSPQTGDSGVGRMIDGR